ncbi:hypothetical protein EBX31_03060 [bacterium]|jgi:uncharacterized protein YbaR (Trm112 family)|nr:hypothetical protein [bacterium]
MSTAAAVDPELLSILRCPETLQELRLAEDGQLARLLQLALQGELKNRTGHSVLADFEALLVREDGKRGYLVRDGIPVMLIEEAVAL